MKTEEILKQIYQELKQRIENNDNKTFIKEYTIPSINYSDNEKKDDLYFASGIEMEIERILEKLEYRIYYSSYKDKYFFSNKHSIVQQKALSEIEKESNSKQQLFEKLEQEYNKLVKELEQKSPREIIDRAYELVIMEQIKYQLQDRNYTENELKLLLKRKDILSEFYVDWRNYGENLGDTLQPTIEYSINAIAENDANIQRQRAKESR